MNKRKKIIVSVVSIFIVLLALVGITYGYFLTRIIGNTNDTSVSITTALLELKYQDDNNRILTYENAVPNTIIGSKSFTVTNTGDGKVNGYGVYLENVINEMDRPQDLEITLTCKSVNTETEAVSGTCEGITTTFPKTDALIVTNDIEVKTRHEYTMTIKYLEVNVNQSVDMGKTVEAKINIYQPENVVDIMGTISGSETGDYVEINSTPKVSEIVNGKYHLKNVEFGNHTLFVKSSTGAVKGSVNLVIDKGDSNSIDNVIKRLLYLKIQHR